MCTQTQMLQGRAALIGYVLITRGPRHFKNLRDVEAAKRQINNLESFCKQKGFEKLELIYDYARSIESLASLPNLNIALRKLSEQESGVLCIDDLGWLLRHMDIDKCMGFLKQVRPYSIHIYGIKQDKRLNTLKQGDMKELLSPKSGLFKIETSAGSVSKTKPNAQTRKATRYSAIARKSYAVQTAQKLENLLNELQASDAHVNHSALANEANLRGILTTRGKIWPRTTVNRTLKKLTEHKAGIQANDKS